MKRDGWIGEFMGTFTLVFTSVGAGAICTGNLPAALSAGFAVLAMAFTYQKVSGAHFNPALSLGLWMSGKISTSLLIEYVFIQTLACTAASFTLKYFLGADVLLSKATVHVLPEVTLAQGFWMEVLLTFFLVETVFYAAVLGQAKHLVPLVMASLVTVNILSGSYLTGAAFNPARALGTAVAAGDYNGIWVHLLGPCTGSILSALLFNFRNKKGLLPSQE